MSNMMIPLVISTLILIYALSPRRSKKLTKREFVYYDTVLDNIVVNSLAPVTGIYYLINNNYLEYIGEL